MRPIWRWKCPHGPGLRHRPRHRGPDSPGLSLGIAAYDEYPDIYEFIGGRVFHAYRPDNNYYLASGSHWQGSAYGPYRQFFLAYAQHILDRMTDGRCVLFRKGLHDAARTFLQYLRPDGQLLRVGDDFNEDRTSYALGVVDLLAFLTGTYYQDPVLKSFAKKGMEGFSSFSLANTVVSPTMFLILNDPELPCAGLEDLPLTWYNGSPLGSVIARSAWNDPQRLPGVHEDRRVLLRQPRA